jgi:hypothetical protein
MTAAERKKAERQRKKAAGLAPLEIWAPPALHAAIKEAAREIVLESPTYSPRPSAGSAARP